VFENRVLRRIFGPKEEEVAGGWRRLHSKELRNLYASANIKVFKSVRMRSVRNVACMGEMRNAYKIVVSKHEGKRPFGRRKHRWTDNIRMHIGEKG
jgi:hypothetical protein